MSLKRPLLKKESLILIRHLTGEANKNVPKNNTEQKDASSVKNDKPDGDDKKIKLFTPATSKYLQQLIDKVKPGGKDEDEDAGEERKGPFKNYQETEERDKKQIMKYEEYFDKVCKQKDRDSFMNALTAFSMTNPQKNLYIDFIYGALLKMKEYNAHTHLEAYRKLMEIFPIGPLQCMTKWQRDNMHFPRHQNCAIQILEQMERNGVMLDEDFARLCIKIFGDWTHVVRKAKRQLYWLPKFKNANPYPVPSFDKFEKMNDLDLALAALERMCLSVDAETRIKVYNSKDIKEDENENGSESTWIASAQSTKQIQLLANHETGVPIFVEGPFFTWIRSKLVEYYVMKTDPLPDIAEKIKEIDSYDLDNVKNLHNPFENPYKTNKLVKKKPDLSPFEMPDGIVYAICCTGTGSKNSLYKWTKILERDSKSLRSHLIIYNMKPKPSFLVDLNKLKENTKQENKN